MTMSENELESEGKEVSAFSRLAFLLRSENRVAVLEVLADTPSTRHELQEATGISRSTLMRILGEFTDLGWIDRAGSAYRTTANGRLIGEQLSETLAMLETIDRAGGLFETIPTAIQPEPAVLTDASVTVAEPGAPFAPLERFGELIAATDTFRCVNSTALAARCEAAVGRGSDSDPNLQGTVIYPRGVVKSLCQEEAPLVTIGRAAQLKVQIHHVSMFGVALFDTRVGIVEYDNRIGAPKRLLETATPAAQAWAEDAFETYRTEAVPLADSDLETTAAVESVDSTADSDSNSGSVTGESPRMATDQKP